jgi:ribonuclease-3
MTLSKIATTLGLAADDTLLREALTHKGGLGGYERLEFLGDRVLNLAVAAWVYRACAGADEGALSLIHTHLVRAETCAAVAEDLGLWEAITTTQTLANNARTRVLADALEAVLAAVYLRAGMDAVQGFVETHFAPHWQDALAAQSKDAKTALQELLQAQKLPLPIYTDVAKYGPDHNAVFTVKIETALGFAEAQGPSKAAASMAAAAKLLAQIESKAS